MMHIIFRRMLFFLSGVSMPMVWASALYIVLCGSCSRESIDKNNPAHLAVAKKMSDDFYMRVREAKFESAAHLFGGDISYDKGLHILHAIDSIRGTLISSSIDSSYTEVKTSNDASSSIEYDVYTSCQYENGGSSESLVISGHHPDSLRITGYRFTLK